MSLWFTWEVGQHMCCSGPCPLHGHLLPSFPSQGTSAEARKRKRLNSIILDAGEPESQCQLILGHWFYCGKEGRFSLGGSSRGLQSPLKEMLPVRQSEEPLWQLHHPSQPSRQQGVTPVKESSWRRQSWWWTDRPILRMRGGCGCPWR